jgi:hypothetical protein
MNPDCLAPGGAGSPTRAAASWPATGLAHPLGPRWLELPRPDGSENMLIGEYTSIGMRDSS